MDEKKYKLICVRKGKTNYARTNNRKNVTLGSYMLRLSYVWIFSQIKTSIYKLEGYVNPKTVLFSLPLVKSFSAILEICEYESDLRSNEHYLSSSGNWAWKKIQDCTVRGSNPIQAWIFSGPIFTTAQVVFITTKIAFIFTSSAAVQIYDFHIFTVFYNLNSWTS